MASGVLKSSLVQGLPNGFPPLSTEELSLALAGDVSTMSAPGSSPLASSRMFKTEFLRVEGLPAALGLPG